MRKKIFFTGALIVGVVIGMAIYKKTMKEQEIAQRENRHVPYGPYEAVIKRPLDIVLSSMAIVVLSPVMLATAALVRLKLGRPILFIQKRPGKDGVSFSILKFRTMLDRKDNEGKDLPDAERMTEFGKRLRSMSIDELPELFNILKGDMALVGPRPLLEQYLPYYTDEEKHRHDVRPGLTGLAQISGRNYLKWDERLAIDIEYVKRITFLKDLGIVCQTIKKVMMRDDVAVNPEDIDEGYIDEIRRMEKD